MRPIDADYLIECINVVGEWALAIGGDLEAIKPVNEGFISLIKSQPTVKAEPKWIPVTEKMPSAYENVLVTYDGGVMRHIGVTYLDNHGNWNCYNRTDVIAWMPLPKPYGVEEE